MKTRIIGITVFLFLQICIQSNAQENKIQFGEWIKDWILAGPFPLTESSDETLHLPDFETDFLQKNGGEKSPVVKNGQAIKFKGSSARWIKYESQDSLVNLDDIITQKPFVAAYAYTEIFSEFDGLSLVALGSNDGGRLWFNGEQVWDYPEARGFMADDDFIPVAVQKGINTILLKIEERGNRWEFGMRILPFNLNEYVNSTDLFQVNTDTDGTPVLRFVQMESVSHRLFKTVHLEIINQNNKNTVWKGVWNAKKDMILPVGNVEFEKYSLKIESTLTDGSSWTNEINFASGIPKKYVLFENGKTDYSIVLGAESTESEQWAAQELQHALFEISGVKFPIKSDKTEKGNQEIIIGYNRHSSAILQDTKKPDDNNETYFYENSGSSILLWGGSKRGSMYAVFSFLENELGCRWYTPSVSIFPSREKYEFTYLNHTESPSIQVRNVFYYEAFNPDWAARNKINGSMDFREQHGGVESYWSVHTFYPLMPPAEFYDKHPEYYSLIDGERIHDHAQLCLTNPDVLDIITERLKETIRKYPNYLIYSVSQNDWRNPCQCDKCQAIAQKEGSESGPVIWFVNQVADRIKDEFPDKYVGTLAYQYTRKPPVNIVPRENVVIRFCSIECCFAHDFETCIENQDFLADLKGWSAIAPHMYIWDYVVNFSHYILPYPNFKVLQQNIKTFRDNKSIGIMEQAAYQSRGGEFAELRAYLLGKLLWNVDVNADEVINDFMSGYYGRSGQYVREYFDFLHGKLTPETHIHLGLRPDDVLFTGDFAKEANKIFDKAERVADNEEIRRRVEMARLPVMYMKCKIAPHEAIYDGTFDRFKMIVKREGITHFAELGQPHMDSFYRQMESIK